MQTKIGAIFFYEEFLFADIKEQKVPYIPILDCTKNSGFSSCYCLPG